MNLAFHRDVAPLMFFPMMGFDPTGKSWGFDRYDDIWAGILSKKIMDHLGWGVVNGTPLVEHRKASKPTENKQKELRGMEANERFWKDVDEVKLIGINPIECYLELAKKVRWPDTPYFQKLKQAMLVWADLFVE
jgi:hypothetical protein